MQLHFYHEYRIQWAGDRSGVGGYEREMGLEMRLERKLSIGLCMSCAWNLELERNCAWDI